MVHKQTYGERMAEWEEERDRSRWNDLFEKAVIDKRYDDIEELLAEAIYCEYTVPNNVTDVKVLALIDSYHAKR